MNRSSYKLLVAVSNVDEGKFYTTADSDSLNMLRHLVSIGCLEEHTYIKNGSLSELVRGFTITPAGREAIDAYRERISEMLWTRGLAIAALLIAIGSLIVSVIALRKP